MTKAKKKHAIYPRLGKYNNLLVIIVWIEYFPAVQYEND